MIERSRKLNARTSPLLAAQRFVILVAVVIVSIAPDAIAQRKGTSESPDKSDKPVAFTESISNLQPVLLKRFTTDSVSFEEGAELSDAMKNQQKELAVRAVAQRIYNRMTRKSFSVYSFEQTPAIAKDNMRAPIVIEGRIDEIKMGENAPQVAVRIKIYAADDPTAPYAELFISGKLRLVANTLTRSFAISAGID